MNEDKPMTVEDVIKKLLEFDPKLPVGIEMLGADGFLEGIYQSKDGYIIFSNHDNIIRKWDAES
jgi:hypothetical protein